MKKIISVLLALIIVLSFTFVSFADMGAPTVPLYYVFVATEGFSVLGSNASNYVELPLGQKLAVYDRYTYEGTEYWDISVELGGDDRYWTEMTNAQMNDTIKEGEVFPTYRGVHLSKQVNAVVTGEPGLNIRYGPSTYFDIAGFIPLNSNVTYEYTYHNSCDWGYVSFGGKTGWISLDYVEVIPEAQKEEPPAVGSFVPGISGDVAGGDFDDIDDYGYDDYLWESDRNRNPFETITGLLGPALGIILIICLIIAVILAITATVVIIIIVSVRKKRKRAAAYGNPSVRSITPEDYLKNSVNPAVQQQGNSVHKATPVNNPQNNPYVNGANWQNNGGNPPPPAR